MFSQAIICIQYYTILYNSIHIIATFSWQVHAAATRVDPSVGF